MRFEQVGDTDAVDRVKLFTLSIQSHINQFNDNTSRFIILALVITAILQVIVTKSEHGTETDLCSRFTV
jgi:hypothetical protein